MSGSGSAPHEKLREDPGSAIARCLWNLENPAAHLEPHERLWSTAANNKGDALLIALEDAGFEVVDRG